MPERRTAMRVLQTSHQGKAVHNRQRLNERPKVRSICWLGFPVSGKDIMSEWIEFVSKWLDYSLVNIRQLWFAWALTTAWVAILTAEFVWHIRKPNKALDDKA